MGRPFRILLSGDKVYACGNCRTHLASGNELVSKHFHSKSGRAYLFHTCSNVVCGPHENRIMTTGKHVVCDIYCVECMSCVGWQYIYAYEESQKYKVGKCILERAMVVDFDKTSPAASLARASLSHPHPHPHQSASHHHHHHHYSPPGSLSTISSGSSGSAGASEPTLPAAALPQAPYGASYPPQYTQQYLQQAFQQAQLRLQQEQARMLLGTGVPYHQLQGAFPLMMQAGVGGTFMVDPAGMVGNPAAAAAAGGGVGMVLFAADDSGSDDEA